MKKTKNEAFCVKPFTQYSSFNDSFFRLCCTAYEPKNRVSTLDQSVESIFNGDYIRRVRKQMIEGDKIRECSACYKLEEKGALSDREMANQEFFGQNRVLDLEKVKTDNYFVNTLDVMDLRVGNICNLRCQSCFPNLSTGVYVEKVALSLQNPDIFPKPFGQKILPAGFKVDQIKESVKSLRLLKLIGGEPLLSAQALDLLKYCVESGLAHNIELHFHSNLTVWNEEFYEYLKKFKRVLLHFSLDGFDKLNSYMRYPSKWETCVSNLEKSIRFFRDYSSVRLGVSPVIQITNIMGITDLLYFLLNEMNFLENGMKLSPILLVDPEYYSPYILPPKLRDRAIFNYVTFLNTLDSEKREFLTEFTRELMSIRSGQPDTELLSRYLAVTIAYDKLRRKNSVTDVFPEFQLIEEFVSEKYFKTKD